MQIILVVVVAVAVVGSLLTMQDALGQCQTDWDNVRQMRTMHDGLEQYKTDTDNAPWIWTL